MQEPSAYGTPAYNPNQPSPHSLKNKLVRVIWNFVWLALYRPSPKPLHKWRCFLLRLFGAKVGKGVHPYPSAKIWAPWNLEMDDGSCLADNTDCYCVNKIRIGKNSTVSQYSYLCGATHDYEHPLMPLVSAPIMIGDNVWITADVFIAPGVTIHDGAVVGARSSVFSDVNAWCVVAGNPAKFIKKRTLK
ncbi:MAG: putative colanic acid biosynthesis acetyltransferase [Acidobacteria bacterium]|nr:putative colanic acid biosynthesis acetyltransferase [Acidobacteriota bacterium]